MIKWWALQGDPRDWWRSLRDINSETHEILWAFSETGKHFYDDVSEGDKVILFTTRGKGPDKKPERGVIGVGVISQKLGHDNSPYWPRSSPSGDNWPWRFKVKIELLSPKAQKGLSPNFWDDVVPISPPYIIQSSLAPVENRTANYILEILKKEWAVQLSFESKVSIDETLSKHKLLINKETANEILAHLNSGKHVIIAGPPGTGKTELATCVAETLNKEPYLVTATSEWSRHHVIGGPVVYGDKVLWESGCLLIALSKHTMNRNKKEGYTGCLLIIDEFNRANMDKAFGELYTIFSSTDQAKWFIPETVLQQIKMYYDKGKDLCDEPARVIIENGLKVVPSDFRIIGTINTFDKSYLYTVSYGLMRRFATVYLDVPKDSEAEKLIVKDKVKELLQISLEADVAIDEFFGIIQEIRSIRSIGTAQIIDAAKFVTSYMSEYKGVDRRQIIDSALVSYVAPQLEGLLENQYKKVKEILDAREMHLILRQLQEMYPTYE